MRFITTQYDVMRRKLGEQNRNGGVGALPLMAKAFIYDADGRLVTENRATSTRKGVRVPFDAPSVSRDSV